MQSVSSFRFYACCALLACVPAAQAAFTTSYGDGSSWNSIYAQGFSPSIAPTPDPALSAGDTVFLSQFSFFKSGNADNTSDIRLVILNNLFGDLTGLNTSSPLVVGVSSNTVAGTASIATGDPISFTFNNLPLTFGNNYAAVYANIDSGTGAITPVLVPSLVCDYVETPPGSGSYHPETNYGTESQFIYAVSNFIATNQFGSFFNTFSFAGDANFAATMDVPEPASLLAVAMLGGLGVLSRRRPRE